MYKVSIIIPCFNSAATIEKTLQSIAEQSYKNFEVIVVDGESQDNTLALVKQYSGLVNLVISEEDTGIYDAMNKGIDNARGSYVIFLGSDDTFYSTESLSQMAAHLTENKVYYGQSYFLKRKKNYDGRFHPFKLALRNICHQAIFYPLPLLKKYRFSLKYPLLADYHLNLTLAKDKIKFEYVDIIVTNFNDAGASGSFKDHAFEKDKLRLVKESLGILPYLYALTRRRMKRLFRTTYDT